MGETRDGSIGVEKELTRIILRQESHTPKKIKTKQKRNTREMNIIVHTELCDIELKRLKKIESYQLTPSLLLLICLFVSWLHLFGSHRAETHEYQRKLCNGENGRKKKLATRHQTLPDIWKA